MTDREILRAGMELHSVVTMTDPEFRTFTRMCREGLVDPERFWESADYRSSLVVAVRDAAREGYADQPTRKPI